MRYLLLASFFCIAFLGTLCSEMRASGKSDDQNTSATISDITAKVTISGEPDKDNPLQLLYTLFNNTAHVIYINKNSLADPSPHAVVSDLNPKNASLDATDDKTVAIVGLTKIDSDDMSEDDILKHADQIITIKPQEKYQFKIPKEDVLKEMQDMAESILGKQQTSSKVRLEFNHLILGFDAIRSNNILFNTSFYSAPLTLLGK